MAQQPKGVSDNIEMTLSKAHFNVCYSKTPIRTIKDFSQVKYVSISPTHTILLYNCHVVQILVM